MIIREGDMVRLRPLRVERIQLGEGGPWFSIEGLRAFPCWSPRDVEEVIPAPRPLAVGDQVRYCGASFTIVGIDKELAWCRYDHGQHETFCLSSLTRA